MKRGFCFIIALCVASLCWGMTLGAQNVAYSVGPGGGGRLIYPNINPLDGDNLFIGCDMGSNFVSLDGGNVFKSKKFLAAARVFYSPFDVNVVYASAANALYKSVDKGATWNVLWPKQEHIYAINYHEANYARYYLYLDAYNQKDAKGVANCQPDNEIVGMYMESATTIYALTSGNYLWKTVDGGNIWTRGVRLLDANLTHGTGAGSSESSSGRFNLYARVTPYDGGLRLLTNDGLFEINADGTKKSTLELKNFYGEIVGDNVYINCPAATVNNLYSNEILKSTNWGTSWTSVSSTIHDMKRWDGTTAVKAARTLNLWFFDVASDGTIYSNFNSTSNVTGDNDSWDTGGIAMSRDDGATWTWALATMGMANLYTYNSIDAWQRNMGYSGSTQGMVLNKSNSNQAIMTNMMDAVMTSDGGHTWYGLTSDTQEPQPEPGSGTSKIDVSKMKFTTTGIEPAGQQVLAIDPFNTQHQIAGWVDIGCYETFDGGQTWIRKNEADGGFNYNTAQAAAFDPFHEGVILIGQCEFHGITGASESSSQGYIDQTKEGMIYSHGGIARSADGGKTWVFSLKATASGLSKTPHFNAPINSGLPFAALITDIKFDPNHENVVYASSQGAGIYKSTDAGITWNPCNDGITGNKLPRILRVSQDGSKLFVGFGTDPADKNSGYEGLYNRTGSVFYLDIKTNATTWQKLTTPNGVNATYVRDMDIDRAGTIYVVTEIQLMTWANTQENGARLPNVAFGGAYVSSDNGATWRQLLDDKVRTASIKVDSRNNDLVYLSTQDGRVMASYKGSATTKDDWIEIDGFPFMKAAFIYEDPDPKWVQVASVCGGTWRMPVPTVDDGSGIGEVTPNQPVLNHAKAGIYTLNGVRIRQATAPGIYVINGKLTIIKKI
ncbi:MAG: hypothetical protein LBN93_03695 [Candidatus Symbiothrix sp.]|jgi:hypothetical protein|nr:hypothetical protein [Candidatus Symbiothrix sp.]